MAPPAQPSHATATARRVHQSGTQVMQHVSDETCPASRGGHDAGGSHADRVSGHAAGAGQPPAARTPDRQTGAPTPGTDAGTVRLYPAPTATRWTVGCRAAPPARPGSVPPAGAQPE